MKIKMIKTKTLLGLAAIGIAALCVTPAQAGVSIQIGFGLPVYQPAPVVVMQPPPVTYYQAPVAVYPPPCQAPVVVVEPQPVWRAPVWVAPGHREFYRHDIRRGGWDHRESNHRGHR